MNTDFLLRDTPEFGISRNLDSLKSRIDRAAKEAGRDPASIHLMAASKTQPPEILRAALEAGHRLFGENRVQEAAARWSALRQDYQGIVLHMIGPLQTNKVRDAVALFDCIQTLDRPDLAQTLRQEMTRAKRELPCLIQVNTGEEPQKHGLPPADLPGFLELCQKTFGLTVTGLMAVPPVDEPPAPHFAFLARLARQHGLPELSMGMSHDFEKAIPLGATYVRVGTALFGART